MFSCPYLVAERHLIFPGLLSRRRFPLQKSRDGCQDRKSDGNYQLSTTQFYKEREEISGDYSVVAINQLIEVFWRVCSWEFLYVNR
jgi:hypothetical protein